MYMRAPSKPMGVNFAGRPLAISMTGGVRSAPPSRQALKSITDRSFACQPRLNPVIIQRPSRLRPAKGISLGLVCFRITRSLFTSLPSTWKRTSRLYGSFGFVRALYRNPSLLGVQPSKFTLPVTTSGFSAPVATSITCSSLISLPDLLVP